jgi:hypothetical protein
LPVLPFLPDSLTHTLTSAVWSSFLELPECTLCHSDCHQAHYLLESGQLATPSETPDGFWAYWPQCPKLYEGTYQIDTGQGSLASLVSWEYELGLHRHPRFTAGMSSLFRYYLSIRDLPGKLREKIAMDQRATK